MKFDAWGCIKKSVDKIQVSLKSIKKKYFAPSPMYIYASLNSS
jgi:hypothetical protein